MMIKTQKAAPKRWIGAVAYSLLGIVGVLTLLTCIFYWRDIQDHLYPGSRVYRLDPPRIHDASQRFSLYQGLNCLSIDSAWMAQLSCENCSDDIVNFYQQRWQSYLHPTKGPGFLINEYQAGPFSIQTYKSYGVNEDEKPLIRYRVLTTTVICK